MKYLILFIALIIFLTGCDEKDPYVEYINEDYNKKIERLASDCIKYDHCICDNYIKYKLETKIDIQTKIRACTDVALKLRRILNNKLDPFYLKSPHTLESYFVFGAKACEDRFSENDNEWFCKMLNKDFETVCPKEKTKQYFMCYSYKNLLKENPIAFWEAYHKVL